MECGPVCVGGPQQQVPVDFFRRAGDREITHQIFAFGKVGSGHSESGGRQQRQRSQTTTLKASSPVLPLETQKFICHFVLE